VTKNSSIKKWAATLAVALMLLGSLAQGTANVWAAADEPQRVPISIERSEIQRVPISIEAVDPAD
jgi:hypothetical protein